MAQQARHSPLGKDRAPFEAATDPALRAEGEAELLRRRLDAMAAVSDGLASRRRRQRWRRKRLGDMLSELDASDATVPNEISAKALRRWARAAAQRRALSGRPRR
ncbi:MAG: hypothetical protein LC808_43775 [Actinobacteria bacterium]|nr:hypothetical protein [Actinomycetota bacterium]